MVFAYTIVIVGICFVILLQSYWVWALNSARRKGKVPERDDVTMFDVRRLLLEGEKELATSLYCELFGISQRRAKKEIDELERSLNSTGDQNEGA